MFEFWPHITLALVFEVLVTVFAIGWVLMTKRESTSAVAWCLVVILIPFVGAFFFWLFGYNRVYRPLNRRRRRHSQFRVKHPPSHHDATRSALQEGVAGPTWQRLGELALKVEAFPISPGNAVVLFHDTQQAYDDLLETIRQAQHHIHLEFFIFRGDATGRRLLELLTEKARAGVEVRLLYDGVGSRRLRSRWLRPLKRAGGFVLPFLPVSLWLLRFRVNLRNHRKIVVVDGKVGYTGGMNIGDEYLGKNAYFGYWRDEFLRLEGPAVAALQRVFVEDWDYACHVSLAGEPYFRSLPAAGDKVVQILESGPDQEVNSIRQVYFAAISSARERIWIASPYFVPDAGMLDALRLARFRGVEVRLLTLLKADHFLSFYASRYYWEDMLKVGMKVYQYAKGMMHSKLLLVDGQWAMVGSANLDNRSLHLNFEIGCMLHSPELVDELELAFNRDVRESILVDPASFGRRSFWIRLVENACRLFSPTL